jgi:uncharacterized protein YqgC (DUF456 family)
MTTTALWILAAALMLVGLAGIVLPALPGVPLLFAGMVVAAAIDDFQRIGWVTVSILGALTVIAFLVDIFAASIGAKRVGASGRAVWGAAIGTVIGIFFGVAGLLLGPFVGAVIGELSAHGRVAQAGRVGVATWLGLVLGTIVKLALACSMLGIFALAFFIR